MVRADLLNEKVFYMIKIKFCLSIFIIFKESKHVFWSIRERTNSQKWKD